MSFESENNLITALVKENPKLSKITSLLRQKLNWNHILQTAEEHRIIPIIFTNLKPVSSEFIPPDTYKQLLTRFQEVSKENFARSTQLIKIVKLIEDKNFSILSYKGMALAKLAYDDITLRQFTDIDLLIRKKDFISIKEILTSNGCRSVYKLTEKQEKAALKYDYEFPFYYGRSNTLLEVHWEFVESFFTFDYDFEGVWERTQNIDLYGKKIPTLSNVDYLIVLCSHGSKHFWKRLSWICDIDRLVRNVEIDWELVIETAKTVGSLRMVLLGLSVSREILDTDLPKIIREKISADETAMLLSKMFVKNVFTEEKEPDDWKEMAKIHLLMRENIKTKFTYSQRLFFTKLVDKLFMPLGRPR